MESETAYETEYDFPYDSVTVYGLELETACEKVYDSQYDLDLEYAIPYDWVMEYDWALSLEYGLESARASMRVYETDSVYATQYEKG